MVVLFPYGAEEIVTEAAVRAGVVMDTPVLDPGIGLRVRVTVCTTVLDVAWLPVLEVVRTPDEMGTADVLTRVEVETLRNLVTEVKTIGVKDVLLTTEGSAAEVLTFVKMVLLTVTDPPELVAMVVVVLTLVVLVMVVWSETVVETSETVVEGDTGEIVETGGGEIVIIECSSPYA